jgi:hypothetical protein
VHVIKIVLQGLYNTIEHSLSMFDPRWNYGSDPNIPMCLASKFFSCICLADDTFGNLISYSFVRYCV